MCLYGSVELLGSITVRDCLVSASARSKSESEESELVHLVIALLWALENLLLYTGKNIPPENWLENADRTFSDRAQSGEKLPLDNINLHSQTPECLFREYGEETFRGDERQDAYTAPFHLAILGSAQCNDPISILPRVSAWFELGGEPSL